MKCNDPQERAEWDSWFGVSGALVNNATCEDDGAYNLIMSAQHISAEAWRIWYRGRVIDE